jgi:hypothetical protein
MLKESCEKTAWLFYEWNVGRVFEPERHLSWRIELPHPMRRNRGRRHVIMSAKQHYDRNRKPIHLHEAKVLNARPYRGDGIEASIAPRFSVVSCVFRREAGCPQIKIAILTTSRKSSIAKRVLAPAVGLRDAECAPFWVRPKRLNILDRPSVTALARLCERPSHADTLVFSNVDELPRTYISVEQIRPLGRYCYPDCRTPAVP